MLARGLKVVSRPRLAPGWGLVDGADVWPVYRGKGSGVKVGVLRQFWGFWSVGAEQVGAWEKAQSLLKLMAALFADCTGKRR